jgi:polysaccharide pyruvyl transferase WcaK-like protein
MNKTGLITFHYANNYGAVLQTLATLAYLQEQGKEVKLIDLNRKPKNSLISALYSMAFHPNFVRFRKKYFSPNSTRRYYSNESIEHLTDDFDTFMVGSDQVWRTKNTTAFGFKYFLDFAGNSKRISYSSSFGVSEWEEENKAGEVSALLGEFDAISVREDSGVSLCVNYFNVKAVKVVDPTLLMPASYYRTIAEGVVKKVPKKYIAQFFLDQYEQSKISFVKEFANKSKLEVVDLTIPKIKFGGTKLDLMSKPVEEWLYIIDNSEFVITESFHCVIFALLFKKKFICIKNNKRGLARLESLLGRLGLMHLFVDLYDVNESKVEELLSIKLDFDEIWKTLNEDIQFSKDFLERNL